MQKPNGSNMEEEQLLNLIQSKPSMDANLYELMDEAIELDVLDEKEAKKAAGPIGHVFLRHLTLIRRCTDQCVPMTNEEAKKVKEMLKELWICSGYF